MYFSKIHNLKRSLDNLCDQLNDQYNINRGGCCYVAYLIACHLDKLGIKYDLIIYDRRKKDEAQVNYEVLHTCNPSIVTGYYTCNHYCISIHCGGIVNKSTSRRRNKFVIKNVTSKHLKWLYDYGDWNTEYDSYNNKEVKSIIDLFFLKYVQNNLSNY